MYTFSPSHPGTRTPDERHESQLRSEHLQFCLHESLQISLHIAARSVELAALQTPQTLIQEFRNAFEAIQRIYTLKGLLEESGRVLEPRSNWLDRRYYQLTHQDLFNEPSPVTQQLLIQQGYKP